jgi:hypothetical protein
MQGLRFRWMLWDTCGFGCGEERSSALNVIVARGVALNRLGSPPENTHVCGVPPRAPKVPGGEPYGRKMSELPPNGIAHMDPNAIA